VGLFKAEKCNNLDILSSSTSGSIPGEGATSFILTATPSKSNLARIDTVEIHHSFKEIKELSEWITNILENNCLTLSDIDLFISGINGDKENDTIYKDLMSLLFTNSTHVYYKYLCGEYDTASAFGLWFSAQIIKNQTIPLHGILNDKNKPINRILLYNQDHFKNHSFILLSKC
jgi:hypothetical protein